MQGSSKTRPTGRSRLRRLWRAFAVTTLLLIVLCIPPTVLYLFPDNPTGLQLILIGGPSMQPLLGTMNLVLLRNTTTFHRFDVAHVRRGGMHRIVGLPGETVWVRQGLVFVAHGNGAPVPLAEPYVKLVDRTWSSGPYHLGPDQYLWMADNRSHRWKWVVSARNFDAILLWPLASWGGQFHGGSPIPV